MNKKALMISLDVLLYLIGFPILMIIAIVMSLPYFQMKIYGFTAAVPIILVALVWLATGISELCIRLLAKKKMEKYPDKKKKIANQGLRMIIAVFCCLTIFPCLLDLVLPPLLNKATQGTIKYEDILMNDQAQNETQRELFDRFIDWNVNNGNLHNKTDAVIKDIFDSNENVEIFGTSTSYNTVEKVQQKFADNSKLYRKKSSTKKNAWEQAPFYKLDDDNCFTAKYKQQIVDFYKGVDSTGKIATNSLANKEVADVLKKCFNTIDNAYQSFDKLTIELALEDMNYLFAYRNKWIGTITPRKGGDDKSYFEGRDEFDTTSDYYYEWCILDLIGEIPASDQIEGAYSLLSGGWDLPYTNYQDAIAHNEDGKSTHNQKRGSLDYMKMAWMNSINLLGIISITTVRNYFYLFSAIIMLTSLVRYFVVRPYYYGFDFIKGETVEIGKKKLLTPEQEATRAKKAKAKEEKAKAKAEAKAQKNAEKAQKEKKEVPKETSSDGKVE